MDSARSGGGDRGGVGGLLFYLAISRASDLTGNGPGADWARDRQRPRLVHEFRAAIGNRSARGSRQERCHQYLDRQLQRAVTAAGERDCIVSRKVALENEPERY